MCVSLSKVEVDGEWVLARAGKSAPDDPVAAAVAVPVGLDLIARRVHLDGGVVVVVLPVQPVVAVEGQVLDDVDSDLGRGRGRPGQQEKEQRLSQLQNTVDIRLYCRTFDLDIKIGQKLITVSLNHPTIVVGWRHGLVLTIKIELFFFFNRRKKTLLKAEK